MKIKKGDNVKIITGKDRGKTGIVKKVLPREELAVIEGVNIRKKHQKTKQRNKKGQIIEFAAPIHVSNVMLIDPKTKQQTRVGYKIDGNKKTRVAKKSGTVI